jgi:hypothetical protein
MVARTPLRTRFIRNLPVDCRLDFAAFCLIATIMPQRARSGKPRGRGRGQATRFNFR